MNHNSESSKAEIKVNIYILAGLLLFFILLFVLSYKIGGTAGKVPLLMSGLAIILSILELFSLIKKLKGGTEGQESIQGIKWYYSAILIALYITILMLFGFIPATFIYLLLGPAILGYRKWHVNGIFAVVSTVILYLGFVKLFMVRLPMGIIITNLLGR